MLLDMELVRPLTRVFPDHMVNREALSSLRLLELLMPQFPKLTTQRVFLKSNQLSVLLGQLLSDMQLLFLSLPMLSIDQ